MFQHRNFRSPSSRSLLRYLLFVSAGALFVAGAAIAQDDAAGAGGRGGRGGGNRAESTREFLGLGAVPDAAAAKLGAPIFAAQCSSCHGADARGGIGPGLINSSTVLDDDHGEKLVPFLQAGRPDKGMPAFAKLGDTDLKNVVEFLHQEVENVANRGTYQNTNNILIGDAKRGEIYVMKNCLTCHALAGDLKGIGAKYRPLDLQHNWIFPPRNTPDRQLHAVVASPEGVFRGVVKDVDDFSISLTLADKSTKTIARSDNVVVQLLDPLAAHVELAETLRDGDMHDVTTYLETLK
jgi:mono/diheme cytochrome c family protein